METRMKPIFLSRRQLLQAATSAVLLPRALAAEEFPTRPLRMVTPYPPGASTDALARIVGNGMTKALGQQVIIDAKAGAGGSLAAVEVKNSTPDGYTFMLTSAGIVTMNPFMYRKLAYDPVKDFAPLSIATVMPVVTVANPSRPYKTMQELIAYARAHPGKVSYGSAGTGTSQHMAGELLRSMAKIDLLHVPYKGGAPAMNDLLGGQVDIMFGQLPSALPHIRSGRIRPLSVGSPRRAAVLPEVPTMVECGVPGYDSDTWYGFMMPAAVPADRGERLARAIHFALQDAKAQLEAEGFVVEAGTPAAMRETIATESAKWSQVVKEAHIRLD
jgi:tripartite-type tricarboxylate transporter receptor subunit TctC